MINDRDSPVMPEMSTRDRTDLWDLRNVYGDRYLIPAPDGSWRARRLCEGFEKKWLTEPTADRLRMIIQEDLACWREESRRHQV